MRRPMHAGPDLLDLLAAQAPLIVHAVVPSMSLACGGSILDLPHYDDHRVPYVMAARPDPRVTCEECRRRLA